jgi:hypothetical protein
MSNVAVASDSLQMSQQLACYSQQRWARGGCRVLDENEHEAQRIAREVLARVGIAQCPPTRWNGWMPSKSPQPWASHRSIPSGWTDMAGYIMSLTK